MEITEKIKKNFHKKYFPEPNTGCWLWLKYIDPRFGYGVSSIKSKLIKAHRLSWLIYRGQIPCGFCVCHRCDVRACVNPDHLFLGTYLDNVRDMIEKKRDSNLGTINRNKTHCKNGHELSEENIILRLKRKVNQRICKVCFKEYRLAHYQKNKDKITAQKRKAYKRRTEPKNI